MLYKFSHSQIHPQGALLPSHTTDWEGISLNFYYYQPDDFPTVLHSTASFKTAKKHFQIQSTAHQERHDSDLELIRSNYCQVDCGY